MTGCIGVTVHQRGMLSDDRTQRQKSDRTRQQQRLINSREVLERLQRDRTRPITSDRTRLSVGSVEHASGQSTIGKRPDASGQDVISIRLVVIC